MKFPWRGSTCEGSIAAEVQADPEEKQLCGQAQKAATRLQHRQSSRVDDWAT